MDLFNRQLKEDASAVERHLAGLLDGKKQAGEISRPHRLIAAMRYGVLNGGKRMRPFLVMETGRILGADENNLVQVAAALECVHCYSLIHDDLPAMDDDALRRGKPTVHIEFDEATAILAGDALLTLAFELLADAQSHGDGDVRIRLVTMLAKASGLGGMAGGQMLDLSPQTQSSSLDMIALMQDMKTGALIKFACEAGAICANASKAHYAALSAYGQYIGQAFQMADDILDVTASQSQLGKNTAKDMRQGKLTQVSILGAHRARDIALELVEKACEELEMFGQKGETLKQAALFTINRKL